MFTRFILPAVATTFLSVASAGVARAEVPAIYEVILDGTASMSEQDFRTACRAVAAFADRLHTRALRRPGERCDWLVVNYFGGPQDWDGTIFLNCSDARSMTILKQWLLTKPHPKHGSTAIYSAILYGLNELIEHDSQLPGHYLKVVVLVTDGEDTGSPPEHRQLVKDLFPNEDFHLIVIGVGDGAGAARALADDATHIERLSSFDDLADKLVLLSDIVR